MDYMELNRYAERLNGLGIAPRQPGEFPYAWGKEEKDMSNVIRRFGQRGAAAAEEAERQEPQAEVPGFLVRGLDPAPLLEVDARLKDLRETLVIPPAAPAPEPDPLHPDVAALVNRAQLEAARQSGDEHVKTAQAIFDEAEAALAAAKEYRDHVYAATERAAVAYATLHARQRRAHEGMARVRSEYLSEELPAPPTPAPPEEAPDAPSA
jgi:hypothetical protein